MAKYTVLSPLKLVDGIALEGEVIELDDDDALGLLAAGVIDVQADVTAHKKK